MIPIRILSDDNVGSILDIRNTVTCTEKAYALKADNQARLFPLISEDLHDGRADMDIKSGMLTGEDVFGLKLVSWFGDNERIGLPALTGLTMTFDLTNGFPKAIMNARHLTAMRTGAAGAVGVKHLAKPNSKTLLVVGTGFQATFQIAAAISEVPSIERVYIFNPVRHESAVRFRYSIRAGLGRILNDVKEPGNSAWIQRVESVDFIAVDNVMKALEEVDAVITATPSCKASILNEWVRPGTHFSCIGADRSGKQEIDEKIFERAIVFVDDIAQASTVGETQSAVRAGIIDRNQLTEIGHLILGRAKGRTSDKDITVFDSTGIALQDLAVSKYLLSKAEEMNIGTVVHL